jgi:hypothetical protein
MVGISTPIFSVNPTTDPAGASGACTSGLGIGQSIIVMGAVNGQVNDLAALMGDSSFNASSTEQPASYSVICKVDVAPSVSFQFVNYSRVSVAQYGEFLYQYWTQNDVTFTVVGTGESCSPIEWYTDQTVPLATFLTNPALAIGAGAHWPLLTESFCLDGNWPTLLEASYGTAQSEDETARLSSRHFQFLNSQNPLEDTLGIVTGLALGGYWGNGVDVTLYTSMTIYGVRIGAGRLWSLVYIVPEVFAVVLLLSLQWTRPGKKS